MKKKDSNFVNPYQGSDIENGMGTPIDGLDTSINETNNSKKKSKVPKAPKTPKPLKSPRSPNSKKSKLPLIIGVLAGVVVILLLVVLGVRMLGSKTVVEPTPPVISNEVEETTPPVIEESPIVDEQPVIPDITPDETEEPEITEPKYSYENDMIGLKFNFNPNLYMKENVADIFNVLKEALPEGEDKFNLYSDKLPSILNIVKLTTGNSDGLYISVSLLPFEIEKETTTLKIDGTTEVVNESIESINLTDEELIEKYDTQIKQGLTDSNCEIITYDKSSILALDGELKGILTSRIYKESEDTTTGTGIVDVIQCTIPVGKNAILITAVTDGSPIEIDKSEIFYEILNSLVVTFELPEAPEDSSAVVPEGNTDGSTSVDPIGG